MQKKKIILSTLIVFLVISTTLYFSFSSKKIGTIQVIDIQSNNFELPFSDQKPVLVNFWATSCSSCIKEMPDLVKLHNKYASKGYKTVAVAMHYDEIDYILNYQKKVNLPFIIIHDKDQRISKHFGDVNLTPTTFLISGNKKIEYKFTGIPDFVFLDNLIKAKLDESE